MGLQYGKTRARAIRGAVETTYRITKYYNRLSEKTCREAARRWAPVLEAEAPALSAEMAGIAEGAHLYYEDILVLNFHGRDLAGGCTMVHIGGDMTEDGRTLTGQTVDWTPSLARYYHVVIRRPTRGLDTIQYTLAGVVGLVGKNEKGTSVFMNILLTSEKIQVGVPAYPLLRLMMEQEDATKAVDLLKSKKRASPFNYMVSDAAGGAYNIEAGPTSLTAVPMGSRWYVHTNHCQCEPMRKFDAYTRVTGSGETLSRYNRMREMLADARPGEMSLDGAFNLLKDHAGYPDSICRHPRLQSPAEGRMKSVGAVFSRQGESGLWVAQGNPCESSLAYIPLS
jgi:isopenicillin-N N-acyltransferase-like protein